MRKWMTGIVVEGDGRGRQLGFPTANIELADSILRLPAGVWAVWVRVFDQVFKGAMHIGPRPTFPGASATVEIHILDFADRDLYGMDITFSIVEKIRDVEKFDSAEELTAAIRRDCEFARKVLESNL